MGKKIKWSNPGLVQLTRNHDTKANGGGDCNPGQSASICFTGYNAGVCDSGANGEI